MIVDVVIPTLSKDEYIHALTIATIDTLRSCESSKVKFNIIVMEKNPNVLFKNADVTLHYDYEFNFNKVLNEGAKHGTAEYILFSNNDVVYVKGFIENLIDGLSRGFASVSPRDPHKTADTNPMPDKFKEGYGIDREMKGWCFLLKREVWEIIGMFDEGVKFYYSDNLYLDQLRFFGFKHAVSRNAFAIHLGKSSHKKISREKLDEYTNKQLLIYKQCKKKYSL